MSENEKVDVRKFANGFVRPVEWWKAASIGLKVAFCLLIVYMVYETFFNKKPTQQIIAKPGSNVSVTQINERKKVLIPFIEVGIEQTSDSDMGTYIRAGARIEF